MRNVAPVALLLALTLCTLRVNAEDEPQIITPEGLAARCFPRWTVRLPICR